MTRFRKTLAPALAGLLLLPAPPAAAWGPKGHELVGRIADRHLSAKARAEIAQLLSGHQFHSISDGRLANWADSIKHSAAFQQRFPDMDKWHYIDLDVNASLASLKLENACPNGKCVLAATKRFQELLKDPGKPEKERREALFFLVHFVGDLHQPLHCAERDNDRGGNLVHVQLAANDHHTTNLHRVWDSSLVDDALGPMSLEDYAARLSNGLSVERRNEAQQGSVEDWILESHKVAREKVYKDRGASIPGTGTPPVLSNEYQRDGAEIVEQQLAKGGLRLAKLLNDTLKD